MIWLPEITEPAENFGKFFSQSRNKILDVRNVWLLNYRNQGGSDHHASYDMEDVSADIIRFMNDKQITLATIGGHGYGAKVAAATASANLNRFTGVIQYEGGPLNHKYHEAYQELESYVDFASKLKLNTMEGAEAIRAIDKGIACQKWASIFKQNLDVSGAAPSWKNNMSGLARNMSKFNPDVADYSQSNGLWPGQALAIFAAHSRWVHLSTNTLPFYNVFPRLQGRFPQEITTHAANLEGPMTHWMHEDPQGDSWRLSQRMWRWLRWNDGANVLLATTFTLKNTRILVNSVERKPLSLASSCLWDSIRPKTDNSENSCMLSTTCNLLAMIPLHRVSFTEVI
jgi:pimeloyl-ACP methyl ester carboxylesterase